MEEKKELLSLDKGELEALFAELGEPRYRAAQLFLQLHRGLSPEEMHPPRPSKSRATMTAPPRPRGMRGIAL